MNKVEIMDKINEFKTDEEIYQFIYERLLYFEEMTTEKTVGQGYTASFEDFISSKVHYKPVASLGDKSCPDLVYDDITPYFELIKKLSYTHEYYNELFLFTPLMFEIFSYMSSSETRTDYFSGWERSMIYYDAIKTDIKSISIQDFHKNKLAMCSENAGLAHNIFKLLGIDSQCVCGKRGSEPHAYNIVFPNGYGNMPAVLFDPSHMINFVNDLGQKYSYGYFKVLTLEEYNNMLLGKPTYLDMSKSASNILKYYNSGNIWDGFDVSVESVSYCIDSLQLQNMKE